MTNLLQTIILPKLSTIYLKCAWFDKFDIMIWMNFWKYNILNVVVKTISSSMIYARASADIVMNKFALVICPGWSMVYDYDIYTLAQFYFLGPYDMNQFSLIAWFIDIYV